MLFLGGVRGSTAPTGAGKINPPMGHAEVEEFYEDAAVREVEEESGLVLGVGDLIDLGSWSYSDGSRVSQHFLVVFSGLTDDYHIGDGDGENEKFCWLRVKDIDVSDWAWSTGVNAVRYSEIAEGYLDD